MNIYVQCCVLILLIAILSEMTEVIEAYRPYRRYHRKPLRRPHWYSYPRSSKYYRSQRYRPKPYQRPSRYRYGPEDEDIDYPAGNRPYTIVIQLPKKEDKYNPASYDRTYEREDSLPLYVRDEDDYIEDEDDRDARMFRVDKKKVRLKLRKGENPQLQIKISRMDSTTDLQIVDKLGLTSLTPIQPQNNRNSTLLVEPSNEENDRTSTDYPTTVISEVERLKNVNCTI